MNILVYGDNIILPTRQHAEVIAEMFEKTRKYGFITLHRIKEIEKIASFGLINPIVMFTDTCFGYETDTLKTSIELVSYGGLDQYLLTVEVDGNLTQL